MRILGIDPGLTRCGLGVVESNGARQVKLIDVDVARSDPQMLPEKRLLLIYNKIEETIRLMRPNVIAIERVFAQENVRSVVSTAQVVGIAMLCAAQHGIPVEMHSPSEVKAAVSGNGHATKAQVQIMVKNILRLEKIVRPKDAADALAIAICHAWRGTISTTHATTSAQHGGAGMLPSAEGVGLTPAQKMWAQAARLQARHGAVAPKK